ncbi:MAG: AAA family ATPase [Planctomycetota bacterium]
MSGNGVHLLYHCDLPNDEESTDLARRFVNAVADRFTDEFVDVDRSVFNAARIIRVAGTTARKGSDVEDRPHRQSFFVAPASIDVADRPLIEFVAAKCKSRPSEKPQSGRTIETIAAASNVADNRITRCRKYLAALPPSISGQNGSGRTLEAAATLARFGLSETEGWPLLEEYNQRCEPPWSTEELLHKLDSAYRKVTENDEVGKLLKSENAKDIAPKPNGTKQSEPPTESSRRLGGWPVAELIADHPERREEIVSGLIRRGEVVNIIGAPKKGKSWLIYGFALALATGSDWLGRPTRKSKVLLVDNEIHPSELSHRLKLVAKALMLSLEEIGDDLIIDPVRGELVCLSTLSQILRDEYHEINFDVIILDAFYRFLPADMDENSNAQMTQMYNRLDAIAQAHDASIVLNHHTSKGDQSRKGLTDVGAGAGAMTRACDSHLIIRPHEQDGCAVLEAACRSNPSPDPVTIEFAFPLWRCAAFDPVLRQPLGTADVRQEIADRKTDEKVLAVIATKNDWMSTTAIRRRTEFGQQRIERSLARLNDGKLIEVMEVENPRNKRTTIEVFRNIFVDGISRYENSSPMDPEEQKTDSDGTPNGLLDGTDH